MAKYHAVFKSLPSLCVGIIIHLIKSNQYIRYCGRLSEVVPLARVNFIHDQQI